MTPKIFNYKYVFQGLNFDDSKPQLPDCTCTNSPLLYNHTGNVISGDRNNAYNMSLRNDPKYCDPNSIN